MKAAAGSSQRYQQEQRAYRAAFCCGCSCNCRLSFSSSEETESLTTSERFPSVSSIAHAMVQERLDQIIRENKEIRQQRRKQRNDDTKFVVMVAMEKCSDDPKEDFRVSMMEMILANRIREPKDLSNLLNYYISMNSDECHGVILEVFHEVCSNLFLACKRRHW